MCQRNEHAICGCIVKAATCSHFTYLTDYWVGQPEALAVCYLLSVLIRVSSSTCLFIHLYLIQKQDGNHKRQTVHQTSGRDLQNAVCEAKSWRTFVLSSWLAHPNEDNLCSGMSANVCTYPVYVKAAINWSPNRYSSTPIIQSIWSNAPSI